MKLSPLAAAAALAAMLVGCSTAPSTPDAFDEISAKVYCEDIIKKQLRDPDSYQFVEASVVSTSGSYNQYGSALVQFRARNGFGGYNAGLASCEAYEEGGETWYKATIVPNS